MRAVLVVVALALVLGAWSVNFCIVSRAWAPRALLATSEPVPSVSEESARPQLGVTSIKPHLTDFGVFGDSFGAVNALFSGLALIFVVIALLLQQREIASQRREFQETLHVQRRQAKVETFASLIEANRLLYEYWGQAAHGAAPPPIAEHPSINWADMMQIAAKRILELRNELEKEAKSFLAESKAGT